MSDLAPTKIKQYERRVRVLFIDKGMFISRLDRPWLDTPFWLQGFLLKTDEELHTLRKYCNSAYIDISRGIEAEFYMEENLQLPTCQFLEKQIVKKRHLTRYQNIVSLKAELPIAQQILETATRKFDLVMDNINSGNRLGLKLLPAIVQTMIDSIIRNPDALPLLCRLRNKKNLSYYHAIDACVLALVFARYMGLPLSELSRMASGALLMDIGKVKVPDKILNKAGALTDEEYGKACTHVDHGVKFLKQDEELHQDIINMVLAHHERADGSGYPNGLKLERIPAFAKVAALIDCYNAMSTTRPFQSALTPYKALQQIYNWRDKFFQTELTEKFLHCMGIYPNGSLVELNTGEVAVVLSQNHSNRLKPNIMPLLDRKKTPYRELKLINLSNQGINKNEKPLGIIRDLEQTAYNIDLSVVYNKLKNVVPDLEPEQIDSIIFLSDKIFLYLGEFWQKILSKIKRL